MRKLCLGLSFAAMAVLIACSSDSGTEVNSELPPNFSKPSQESGNEYDSSSGNENVAIVDPSTVVTGTMTDERDGQTYRTVKIGNQEWMAENLNYRYLGPTADEDSSSFCYNDDPANCEIYGRLYMWSAAMDSAGIIKGNMANGCGYYELECTISEPVRGVCPEGWHLPSRAEWGTLIVVADGSIVEYDDDNMAGIKLKSSSGWDYSNDDTNTFGFSALPAGIRYYGDYIGDGEYAGFWSSSEYDSGGAYDMSLDSFSTIIAILGYIDKAKGSGFSVRCLKD